MCVPLTVTETENVETQALIDCGAGGMFIDQNFAKKFKIKKLETPIIAKNVDGTTNKKGTIKNYVDLEFKINSRKFTERFYVTGLGRQKMILGFTWLNKHNPTINWKTGEITWTRRKLDFSKWLKKDKNQPKTTIEEIPDPDRSKNRTTSPIYDDTNAIFLELSEQMEVNKITVATELAVKENIKKKEKTDEELIPKEYHEYLDIFSEEKAARFPDTRPWDHKIEMKEGFEPKSFKNYNLTPVEQLELDKFLKENLEKGYIRPSQSPMASPFFFVSKKDGKLRPCQDYRYLNDWTIKNSYPLPLISDILDKLKDANYFTKLDVRWGYNNIRIRKGDEWKAAFKTNKGLFEPTVMFFGMCNSPATFQSMMDDIFVTMIDEKLVIIYMDDILIFADTKEELRRRTKMVLEKLREHDLYLKAKKCEFEKTRIEYLGMIIEEGKITMDTVKLAGIRDWPTPTTVKQVRSFLGFGNFYRKFISHYSDIAKPLNNLTKKDQKFEWTNETQTAFDTLKKRFTEEPVLMMPDHSKPFQIESDASKVASGAVLTQTDSNGERHPVAFLSQTFTETERRYEIYDRELLGIIRALREWRHYIQGSGHTTTIFSDHKNLTYFRTAQKLKDRQARWSLYLSEFNIKLIHLPGTKMIQSDTLSRRPDHGIDESMKNEEQILLPENLFINLLDTELQERILKAGDLNSDIRTTLETIMGTAPSNLQHDVSDWKIETVNGQKTIFYQGKNYIPEDTDLRRDIVKMFHDHETAGHPGELETYNAVRQHYWWPGMRSFVKTYVKGCGICQQFKINRSPANPAYQPIEGAKTTRPFAYCSMDLITDLPPIDGYDSILVVVDRGLSKGVILSPCAKTITWEGIAELLRDNLFKRFGLPEEIIHDRDPRFAARSFQELFKLLNIKSSMSTAFHPQTDGATERVNQEIEAYLSIYCTAHPEDWLKSLTTIEFTHNNRRHADRNHSPFELILGDSPISTPITFSHTKYPTIEEKMKRMIHEREEALAAHELARTKMANRKHSKFIPFEKGQKVWLDIRNLKTGYHKKIAPKREGPFEIEEMLGPVTYRLKLPESWKIHNVFHATLLRPYIENEIYGNNYPRPPMELLEGEKVYEVENIIKHRRRGRGYQYYVKWKGYPITEATWESESAFSDDGDMLKQYKLRHQL